MTDRRERLAIAIFGACWRMYPEIYARCGPAPESAWLQISEEQRKLFRHYADAAMEFLGA